MGKDRKIKVDDLVIVPQPDGCGGSRGRGTPGRVVAMEGEWVSVETPHGRLFPELRTLVKPSTRAMRKSVEEALCEVA